MGFEQLKQAIEPGIAQAPLTKEQVAFADEKLADAAALGIVLNDLGNAQRHVSGKGQPQKWSDIDELYIAFVQAENWPGTDVPKAHLEMPLVLEVIESMLPQIFLGFFSDKTPFSLSARGRTSQKAARAAEKILKWAIKKSGFKEEIRKILKSCLLYGTGVGKWGWEVKTQRQRQYKRDGDEVMVETVEVPVKSPTFEWVSLDNFLVDSGLRSHNIQDAKFAVVRKYVTAYDLDDMRDDETYKNIPTREQLKEILAQKEESAANSMAPNEAEAWRELQATKQWQESSSDPLKQPLEILEHWTAERVTVVLQQKIVIRNEENEYDRLPFVSTAFIDVLKSFYGLGIAWLLKGEQKLEAGVVNAWLDSLALTLSPSFQRKNGVGQSAQNIRVAPGRVVNDQSELVPIDVQSVSAEALNAIQNSESRARRRVGANFGPDMPNQAMRTAEGVQEFTSGIQVKTQYFIELFGDMVFIPTLEAFIGLCKDNLSPADINEILTEEEGQAFDDDHLNIYNGQYNLEVLTSTKLAAKRAMISMLPTLMQMFQSAPVQQALVVQGKKLDMGEFVTEAIDLAGWDTPDLIVDMTPDDMNRAMQMNPQVARTQGDIQVENVKAQHAQELEQTKGDVRGGLQVVKHVLDQSGKHDESQREQQAQGVPSFWPYGASPSSDSQPLAQQPPQ